jgi:hypothetical protein
MFGWLICNLAAGCYQPKEGCLDIGAVNYDVSADDPCPDCCKYPQLSITFQHQVLLPDTTLTFKYNTSYPTPFDGSHYFSIERSRFFVSNFRLVNDKGAAFGSSDSIQLEAPAGTALTVENNFAKVDRDIFQPNVIGKFLAQGNFNQLRFTVGLESPLQQTNPETIPGNHALSTTSDTIMYKKGTGYIPNLLVLNRDTLPDTTPWTLWLTDPKEISLDLPKPFQLDRGFNVKITLRINYLGWFEGIDFQNDSPLTIQQKITSNLPYTFFVESIKME